MSVKLDSRYQVEAYEKVKSSIKEKGKAGIIMPTGTGKSYIAMKLIEDNLNNKQILYASPSATINVQVKKLIKQNYSKEDAEKILSKIKFTTYSAIQRRYTDKRFDMREYNSDMIILDEIHRSGAEKWGAAIDYLLEQNNEASILGMTATPVRSNGKNMIQERCGDVSYELKISEAVAKGILKLPVYVSARHIFEDEIETLEEQIKLINDEKKQEELNKRLSSIKRNIQEGKGLQETYKKYLSENGKYLIFCNPGDDIEKLQEKAKEEGVFDDINENQTYLAVESAKTDTENNMALRKFERKQGNDLRLLYSKNMLNEGIHDQEIAGEIMQRPTKSYTIFVQQLGRVLSKDRQTTPLVLDLVGNIQYFKEFRIEVQNIIKNSQQKGDYQYDEKVIESFKIIEEKEDFIKSFEEIESQIDQYINKSSIGETLDVLESLNAEGIDVTKLPKQKLINGKSTFINLSDIDDKRIENIINKYKLDPNYNIGRKISSMLSSYRGYGASKITEENIERIESLGFTKEIEDYKDEILNILEYLKQKGIDITNIARTVTKNGERKNLTIGDIKYPQIENVINELGITSDYEIGAKINYLNRIGKGTKNTPITEEQLKRIEALGLVRNPPVVETLETLEILKSEGIDITKISCNKRNPETKKMQYTNLGDIKSDKIDYIIEKYNLDREYLIGQKINSIQRWNKGKLKLKVTEEQAVKLKKLGIIADVKGKLSGQDIGKIGFGSSVGECDQAQQVVSQLIEKTKEEGKENIG